MTTEARIATPEEKRKLLAIRQTNVSRLKRKLAKQESEHSIRVDSGSYIASIESEFIEAKFEMLRKQLAWEVWKKELRAERVNRKTPLNDILHERDAV